MLIDVAPDEGIHHDRLGAADMRQSAAQRIAGDL
jgi:hypothetical protein